MGSSFVPLSNHGIMDKEEEEEDELGSFSSFSNDDDDDDDDDQGEDISSNSIISSKVDGPLFQMSSIFSQLPFKRGLSKHFEGKSQSFTSLTNVKSLEDLVKPERPLRSKQQLKSSKSYGWGLDSHKALSPKHCSRSITKKSTSRGSFSSLGNMKRSNILGNRPPIPTQRSSGNLNGHTLLFA